MAERLAQGQRTLVTVTIAVAVATQTLWKLRLRVTSQRIADEEDSGAGHGNKKLLPDVSPRLEAGGQE